MNLIDMHKKHNPTSCTKPPTAVQSGVGRAANDVARKLLMKFNLFLLVKFRLQILSMLTRLKLQQRRLPTKKEH
ncbi:hypothetical protein VIGAN_11204100 [Vigna angularis var. angularis]|uniref:Uncharacterized protein n=1 Tax=Vigna angularis var. angularis TaxID=157739 RepID=A0A0S3TBD6_PHAAN|nr:hypothetical protein VIGAN_11204100 [Vigna angularis var. angularis]